MIKTRAPGKLFLLGEYVVLYGGPAILISVNRYLNVSVQSSAGPSIIRSKGADLPTIEGHWDQQRLSWTNTTRQHDLVLSVINQLTDDGVLQSSLPHFEVCIDSSELFNKSIKLGLGSSAAVTHAFARALVDFANQYEALGSKRHVIDPAWVFNTHQTFQHGRGSGADVAAGVVGGSFSFQRLSDHCVPHIQPIELPRELYCCYVWVGRAASTSNALGQLEQAQLARPARFSHLLTPLMALAERGRQALEDSDIAQFMQVAQSYCHNLSEFGDKVGINIVSDEHIELSEIAAKIGVSYKPSGAGGGDFGIAFSSDINSLREFERQAEVTGCEVMALELGRPCHRYED